MYTYRRSYYLTMTFVISSFILFVSIISCHADFFSDIDKLDIDTQLREIDKMISDIDDDEDKAYDSLKGKSSSDDTADDINPLDALAGLFGAGECKFTCKNGKKPYPNRSHKPTSNGCGSFGMKFELDQLPEMTFCCDAHDICYDTCNSDRSKCDKSFKQCLQDMCGKLKKQINKKQLQGCLDTANLMHTGTLALGCQPYLDSQQNACSCGETQSNDRKSQDKSRDKTEQHGTKATPTKRQSDRKLHPDKKEREAELRQDETIISDRTKNKDKVTEHSSQSGSIKKGKDEL